MSTTRAAVLSGAYDVKAAAHVTAANVIQESLSTSKSCVSAPFVSDSLSLAVLLSNGREMLTMHTTLGCEAVIQQATEFVSAQHTPLLVLRGVDMEAFDGLCMQKVVQAVQNVAQGDVVTLFSSDSDGTPKLPTVPKGASRRLAGADDALEARVEVDYPGVQYTTPAIAVGVFVGFFMLFFVYVMVYCLMAIDTPQRFADRLLVVAKES